MTPPAAAGPGTGAVPAEEQPAEGAGSVRELVERRSVIVCCGSGGVGKTTVAGALALAAARLGRRACVVTIDPARRLADALGIDALTNTPTAIPGAWPGELHALMLDPKKTFDDLVRRYASTDRQVETILANRLYRNLTSALSGTQEYMAMEKLYELTEDHAFDLVVVDTPPTRSALDFIDAPQRLTRFLGHRLFQLVLAPTRAYMKAVSVAAQALLRTISRVAGAEIVEDAVVFFEAFEGMEDGFLHRAEHMGQLLRRPTTSFVLVSSPRPDTVDEARWFAARLEESHLATEGLVVNRVHPRFGGVENLPDAAPGSTLGVLVDNLRSYEAVAEREEALLAELIARIAPAPVLRVPLLTADVHDLAGLEAVAHHLLSPGAAPGSGGDQVPPGLPGADSPAAGPPSAVADRPG